MGARKSVKVFECSSSVNMDSLAVVGCELQLQLQLEAELSMMSGLGIKNFSLVQCVSHTGHLHLPGPNHFAFKCRWWIYNLLGSMVGRRLHLRLSIPRFAVP